MMQKRGQLTVMIILAIVIVAAISIYFFARGGLSVSGVAPEFAPVYDAYSSCIQDKASEAIGLSEQQGGRIYLDDYIPGSEYAPYSSQLNFLGASVPYWYYVAGNGVIKEQAPSQSAVEADISRYIKEHIGSCDYERFYAQGFGIDFGTPDVKVSLGDSAVSVDVNSRVVVDLENKSAVKESYSVSVPSKFGKFFKIAQTIYAKEKSDAFLEKYAVDVVYSYAPVDGVEIGCAPKVWKTREVVDQLKQGLEANIGNLKTQGSYYTLQNKKQEYFVVDQASDEAVNFIYSPSWPSKVEIAGADNELMIAEPIGNREGMGILGFCYAPYHFVYDVGFPVMVQVYDNQEIFQFPVVAIVNKNVARTALPGASLTEDEEVNICNFKNQDLNVNVYDINLKPIDANLSYSCFDQECSLGETSAGKFSGKAPGCVNGYLIAQADGYAEKKGIVSTNSESSSDIVLERQYSVNVSLKVGGVALDSGKYAVVSFSGAKSISAALPGNPGIDISEGSYNLSVFVYGNSSLTIPASTKRECQDLPKGGIMGLFGGTEEKCFDIKIPETKIEQALIGGGRAEVYLLPEDLQDGKIVLNVNSLPVPNSLEKLANNYEIFDAQGVDVS